MTLLGMLRRAHRKIGVHAPFSVLGLVFAVGVAHAAPDAEKLCDIHCLPCHAPNHLGSKGPTLLPESPARLKKPDAAKDIADDLPAKWEASDITASRIVNPAAVDLPAKPVFEADPMNLTLLVEHGDHHITVLDGARMEPIARFATRFALHGEPQFAPDGRYAYWASCDGWITKFDLWNLMVVAETRVGIHTRNVAVSSDGRYVMAANHLPHTLVALDASDLTLVKVIPVVGKAGKASRVSAVYDARPRNSFIAALKDIPEVWDIPYDGRPVYKGLVHDYQLKEAIPEPGPLPVRQIVLDDPLDDFLFDQNSDTLLGTSRMRPTGQVIHLGVGRKIADLDLAGMPHLGAGVIWNRRDADGRTHRVMASPSLNQGLITVIEMKTWKAIKTIPTLGAGSFLRSHEHSPYVWADVSFGEARGTLHVIDKHSLDIVATLKPLPGKTVAHVDFDRHGKYAMVSIREMDGALIVYDAKTLAEIKRLPMMRPAGKHTVWNRTWLSEATRH